MGVKPTGVRQRTLTGRTSLRNDAARNVNSLLIAAGKLLRSDPEHASMAEIAREANLSVATAYRYFPTLQDLHSEYIFSVVMNLRDYSLASPLSGKAMFVDVVAKWFGILETYGKAMTQVRSRQGFLARWDADDPVIALMSEVWDRPLREALRELGVSEKHFRHALFLFNIIFDAREVIDIHAEGYSESDGVELLTETFYGAVRGFAQEQERKAAGTHEGAPS